MTATTQFDQVSVIKRANVYFDGKCVSHTVLFADGSRKTLGVILPGTLNFGTDAAELMEVQAGKCRIRLEGSSEWQTYGAGESFSVPGMSRFDIEVIETLTTSAATCNNPGRGVSSRSGHVPGDVRATPAPDSPPCRRPALKPTARPRAARCSRSRW
jgi:purine/pyrimidine-nucleoside phosphorylase